MYIQSLVVLMIVVFIQGFQYKTGSKTYFWLNNTLKDTIYLFWANNQFLFIILTIYSVTLNYSIAVIRKAFKSSANMPTKLLNVENKNFDGLSFLFTYIIPLIAFYNHDSDRSLIIFVVLVVITGVIFINTSLFYANPTLLFFGYSLNEAETLTNSKIIIISKKKYKISKNDYLKLIHLSENIYLGIK